MGHHQRPAGSWGPVASSSDGTKLFAILENGPIYISTDSGATWTASNSPFSAWCGIASSSDGKKLVAIQEPGQIYTSTNWGAN